MYKRQVPQQARDVGHGDELLGLEGDGDLGRMQDATARMDAECPLGSGALAGTTYPLDRCV